MASQLLAISFHFSYIICMYISAIEILVIELSLRYMYYALFLILNILTPFHVKQAANYVISKPIRKLRTLK